MISQTNTKSFLKLFHPGRLYRAKRRIPVWRIERDATRSKKEISETSPVVQAATIDSGAICMLIDAQEHLSGRDRKIVVFTLLAYACVDKGFHTPTRSQLETWTALKTWQGTTWGMPVPIDELLELVVYERLHKA